MPKGIGITACFELHVPGLWERLLRDHTHLTKDIKDIWEVHQKFWYIVMVTNTFVFDWNLVTSGHKTLSDSMPTTPCCTTSWVMMMHKVLHFSCTATWGHGTETPGKASLLFSNPSGKCSRENLLPGRKRVKRERLLWMAVWHSTEVWPNSLHSELCTSCILYIVSLKSPGILLKGLLLKRKTPQREKTEQIRNIFVSKKFQKNETVWKKNSEKITKSKTFKKNPKNQNKIIKKNAHTKK